MAETDILIAAAFELPSNVCGGRFGVTLRQVLLSQGILQHEGCVRADQETECPPSALANLAEHELIDELERVWTRLDERARALGGRLSLTSPQK